MSEKYGIITETVKGKNDEKVTRVSMNGLNQKQQQMKDLQFEFYKILNKA